MNKKITFSVFQIAGFLDVIAKHDVSIVLDEEDEQASEMFTDLLVAISRSLTAEQVNILFDNI